MTRAKSRLTVLLAFFAVLTMCLGIAFMPKQEAFAAVDTSTGFYVEDGASARLVEGQSGIKWTVHITKAKYNEIKGDGNVTGIGLEIRPSGLDAEGNEYAWTQFTYAGELTFDEADDAEYVFPYAIYYDEIINDMNAELVKKGEAELTEDQEKAYLAQAYAMNLEVRPFVNVLPASGIEESVYGEADDTSRSLQGVALAYLLQDIVAEDTAEYNTLVGYIPGTYNEVAEEFKAEETFYSNYDASGVIPIDNAIPMENAKIYYGAKEVTDLYADGVVNLSGVQTKVTTDGTCSDYLTILDTASGDVYKQEFVGVTIAIDEATDFDIFSLKGAPVTTETSIIYDGDDFVKDGYYILVNDINANGYIFRGAPSGATTFSPSEPSNSSIIESGYGFSGIFDGQGHTVTGLAITGWNGLGGYGLFGFVNGGTIKNVEFDGLYNTTAKSGSVVANTGALAYSLINGGKIQDVKIINRSTPGGSASSLLYYTSDATSSLSRVYIQDNSGSINVNSGAFWKSNDASFEDVYIVSKVPAYLAGRTGTAATIISRADGSATTDSEGTRFNYIIGDAEYVDGVLGGDTRDYVTVSNGLRVTYKCSEWIITDSNGKTYGDNAPDYNYSIKVLTGVKRYTTLENMQDDAAHNDFSSWNQDVWEIVDGIPTFRSTLSGDYTAFVDGNAIEGQTIGTYIGTELDVAVQYQGASVGFAPEITAISGSEFVSINGTTITASEAGSATIKVAYRDQSWQFTLNILEAITDIEQEYHFSAHDGQFYDSSFTVVALADILDKEISAVYDENGDVITVTDGKLMNVDLGKQNDWLATNFVFNTTDGNYRLNVKAADAIIDEAADLAVLTPQATGTVTATSISYDGDDFVDDGYYVVVKNINASSEGYFHNKSSMANFYMSTPSMETVAASGYGFSGVFDGQGHTISNLFVRNFGALTGNGSAGLFGWVNGGTIKNIKFSNIFSDSRSSSGVTSNDATASLYTFATYLVNGAKIEDAYIDFGRQNGYNSRQLCYKADSTSSLNRVYLVYNRQNSFNSGGGGLFVSSAATMTDVYWVSKLPVVTGGRVNKNIKCAIIDKETSTVYAQTEWIRAGYIAETIDGVAQNGTVNYVYKSGDASVVYSLDTYDVYNVATPTESSKPIATYSATVVNGIKQYTTVANMQADAANNSFTGWDSTLWTITNGVPNMKVIG